MCLKYTPAEILTLHDPDGRIAENLARWAAAWRGGILDLTDLKPALAWVKIVELQAPLLLQVAISETSDRAEVWLQESTMVGLDDGVTIIQGAAHQREMRDQSAAVVVVEQPSQAVAQGESIPTLPIKGSTPQVVAQSWGAGPNNPNYENKSDHTTQPNNTLPLVATPTEPEPDENSEIWAIAKKGLQGAQPKATYDAHFARLRLIEVKDEDTFVLEASNPLSWDWLEYRLKGVIERELSWAAQRPIKAEFIYPEAGAAQ